MDSSKKRRMFQWPQEARQLVRNYREQLSRAGDRTADRRVLVSRLVEVSGNPRDACLRFVRQHGIVGKRSYRAWTTREQQQLADLIASIPVEEAARMIHRPAASVRSMLHRLGLGARRSHDWFTKSSLAEALHTGREEVQKWIDRGWLKSRVFVTGGVKMQVIEADDFCEFFKKYGKDVASRRISHERLWFVSNYVFPPSHSELLSVRGSYKKSAASTQAGDAPNPSRASDEVDDEKLFDQSA